MEENKFEKQVQQKMDELKIHPSDSVWEKIEGRIEKKKRSNRGLFLFVIIFLLFLTGGDLLWNHIQHSIKEANNFERNTGKISIKENKNGQVKPNFIPGSINSKNNVDGNASVMKNNNKNSSQPYKISAGKKINLRINPGEKATIVLPTQQEVKNTIFENANNRPGIIRPGDIPPETEKIKADIKLSAYDKLEAGNLPKSLYFQDEKSKIQDTIQQILTSSETIQYSKKNKWRPGVLLSGGISGAGNNFLRLASPSAEYLNAAGQGTTPGTTSAGIPSVTRPAFGFMIGIFEEKNIFKKAKLALGINFKSFNTSNKVGFRNDTTGLYLLNTVSLYHTYINHYNFIELPVTLKAQIGKGKNIPFFWEGGFVVSELISSNALQFNQNAGYYYTNNSVFNKTQFGLNTNISLELFSKQKTSVLIGPYFYYSASRLANEGLYGKKHFVSTGLHTEILFGK